MANRAESSELFRHRFYIRLFFICVFPLQICTEEPAPVSSPSPDICPPDIHISGRTPHYTHSLFASFAFFLLIYDQNHSSPRLLRPVEGCGVGCWSTVGLVVLRNISHYRDSFDSFRTVLLNVTLLEDPNQQWIYLTNNTKPDLIPVPKSSIVVQKLLKMHWAALLHFITINTHTHTVVYFDSVPHTLLCCQKCSPKYQIWINLPLKIALNKCTISCCLSNVC